MGDSNNLRYEFDDFSLDVAKRLLLHAGQPVPLQGKAFDTLLVLIENRDRLVEKNELLRTIWPDTFVEEINLTVNISLLRKALGESPSDHRYIVTTPRRGYRFVAEVRELRNSSSQVEAAFARQTDESQRQPLVSRQVHSSLFFNEGYVALLVVLVVVVGIGAFLLARKTRHQSKFGTIAVLPFRELGTDGEDHLGAGMADALITRLSRIERVVVRPTSAVLKYSDVQTDPLTAGRELEVETLLEGKMQRVGNRVRVTAQLFNVNDGRSLWAGTFDEDFSNILSLQDLISAQVAKELAPKLTSGDQGALVLRQTSNHLAWEAYSKGRHFLSLRTEHGFRKAIESFEEASAADAGYALAYVGLADSHSLLGYYSFEKPETSYKAARAAANRALDLDPALADAHVSLALIRMNYDWDFAGAEESYLKALELDPNHGVAHARYAICLLAQRKFAEALTEIDLARRTDRRSLVFIVLEGDILRYARRDAEALDKYQEALNLNPNNSLVHAQMAEAYEAQGKFAEAVSSHAQALALSGDAPEIISTLNNSYRRLGMVGYRRKSVELMEKAASANPALTLSLASQYLKAGDKLRALDLLEQARLQRQPAFIYVNVDPIYDSLRGDPRFIELLERAGLIAPGDETTS